MPAAPPKGTMPKPSAASKNWEPLEPRQLLAAGAGPSFADADVSFGAHGEVIGQAPPQGYADTIDGIALQPDGKLVAMGNGRGTTVLIRYNRDGAHDDTFAPDEYYAVA